MALTNPDPSRETELEAIGRRASGVAHDFDNLLTAIAGRAYLALAIGEVGDRRPGAVPPRAAHRAAVARMVREVLDATARARAG